MRDAWAPERVVSPELAGALIEGQFPELAPADVELFGEGWDNTAYRTRNSLVFRFPRRQIAVPLIETEIRTLPGLAPRLPVAIPVPRWVGRGEPRYPWPFAGYVLIPGRTADRAGLEERDRGGLAHPLGDFLSALHQSPLTGAGPDAIGRLDVPRLSAKIRNLVPELAGLGLIPDPDAVLNLVDSLQDAGARARRVLVHGDLYARHVILTDQGALGGVIDWGDLHANDPAADLSIAWTFLPPSAREAFRSGYGDIDPGSWRLARLRGLHYAEVLLKYGSATQDSSLLREGKQALAHVLVE